MKEKPNCFFMRKIEEYTQKIESEEYRRYHTILVVFYCLSAVSLFMCIMNIVTEKYELAVATLAFGTVTLIYCIVLGIIKKLNLLSYVVISIILETFFLYLVVHGGTEGFSAIWVVILAISGCITFGLKLGSIYNLAAILQLVFLFFFPIGQRLVQADYTHSFLMRFPILYTTASVIGFFLEVSRSCSYKHMLGLKNKFETAMNYDILTGLHNRTWFNTYVEKVESDISRGDTVGVLIADIDDFKKINDTYGHIKGDEILKIIAQALDNTGEFTMCRWGGEEFITIVKNYTKKDFSDLAERMREKVNKTEVNIGGNKISISIGISWVEWSEDFSLAKQIHLADDGLIMAKRLGKNLVCSLDNNIAVVSEL